MPLNDARVRALPFCQGQRDYPDEAVKGLYLRVGRRTKTFMLTLQRPRRRLSIGHYPEISLAVAREKARDLLAEARLKKDPSTITLEAALADFKAKHIPTMRPTTQKQARRHLDTRFIPLLKKRLVDLKPTQIADCLDAIPSISERYNAYIYLRAFLNWCYRRGWLDRNPISRLKPPRGATPRERVLSDAELRAVWNASQDGDFGALIRILILTAQRKGQWYNFGPEFIQGDTIVFPASVMKGKKSHTIPLTPTIARTIGNHSFKGFSEGRKKRELLAASRTSGWTLHDLRRTAATRMAELGIAPHVIERLLAHQSGIVSGMAAIYNRASYMSEMRDALSLWEARLYTLLLNEEETHGVDHPGRDRSLYHASA